MEVYRSGLGGVTGSVERSSAQARALWLRLRSVTNRLDVGEDPPLKPYLEEGNMNIEDMALVQEAEKALYWQKKLGGYSQRRSGKVGALDTKRRDLIAKVCKGSPHLQERQAPYIRRRDRSGM